MKYFILICLLMTGCCESHTEVEPPAYWKRQAIDSSLYIVTDPANGQEYIWHYSGGITPRLK
jgi:hypothetical protein